MKKITGKWLRCSLLLLIMYAGRASAQYGTWGLLGNTIVNNNVTYPSAPSTTSSGITTNTGNQYQMSDGYSSAGFYVVNVGGSGSNMQLFKTGSTTSAGTFPSYSGASQMSGDVQIVQVPGTTNSYYVIYAGGNAAAYLLYNKVTVDASGNPSIVSPTATLIKTFAGQQVWEMAFTTSQMFDAAGDRYLFAVGGSPTNTGRGVYRYTITSSGISTSTEKKIQGAGSNTYQYMSSSVRLSPDQHFLVWQSNMDASGVSNFWILPLINYDSYADYNSTWGTVPYQQPSVNGGIFGGAIFSPDSRTLYYSDNSGLEYATVVNGDAYHYVSAGNKLSATSSIKYRKSGLAIGVSGELFAIDWSTYTLSYFDIAGSNAEVTTSIPVRSNGSDSYGGTTGYARLPQDVLFGSTDTPFNIANVDINTKCDPADIVSSSAPVPTFTVTASGGSGTYTYSWYALPGNTATLSDYHSATPSIVSGGDSELVYFYLTVIDNHGHAAGRVVRLELSTEPTFDLASRDSYYDMYREGNDQARVDPNQWHIWSSPDIWNRHYPDGMTNDTMEAAVYFDSSGFAKQNYLYVNVRNVGCADYTSGAKVLTYWTIGALDQETWRRDWTTSTYSSSCTPVEPLGQPLNPISIPSLTVGSSEVLQTNWAPPDPTLYYCPGSGTLEVELCFLARIVDHHNVTPCDPDGMTFCEDTSGTISANVDSNNNIITYNTSVAYVTTYPPTIVIVGGNRWNTSGTFSFQMINSMPAGTSTLFKYASITVSLGDMYSLWQAGGSQGKYKTTNPEARTVTFDGTNEVRLDNIVMPPNSLYPLAVQFNLRSGADPSQVPTETVDFRELYFGDTASGGDSVIGNYTFITASGTGTGGKHAAQTASIAAQNVKVYPNPAAADVYFEFPAAKKATIKLMDISGRVVSQQDVYNTSTATFDVSDYVPGLYLYQVIDNDKVSSGKLLIGK